MARTVRKVKRGKVKELCNNASGKPEGIPGLVVSLTNTMKVKAPRKTNDKYLTKNAKTIENANPTNQQENIEASTSLNIDSSHNNMADFSVNQLIAELSENSKASKEEIENIQRKLLHQANEILKVNALVKTPAPQPRIIDCTQKYSTNTPIYGRIPVIVPRNPDTTPQVVGALLSNRLRMEHQEMPRNNMSIMNTALGLKSFVANQHDDMQLVPEKLRDIPLDNGAMINSAQGNMQRVVASAETEARGGFLLETGSVAGRTPAASTRVAFLTARGVESVPPYRMPPAPEATLPGAPAPSSLHTHSAKFPIEREVILSTGDKNSKVPILHEARKRQGRLGSVAPDTPPKPLPAWTHSENQQAGTSGEIRQYHEQTYGYSTHQNQGATPRIAQHDTPKPPIPVKNNYGIPNTQQITVTVETGKDTTKDAPKSSKSVSKTYHTLKDMISSRFKSKDGDNDKTNEPEISLNNSEERKKPEVEPNANASSNGIANNSVGVRKVEQGIYGRPAPQNRPDMQYGQTLSNNMAYPSPSPQRQMSHHHLVQQQMLLNQQARSQEMLASPHTRPQALGADALYQPYGPQNRRSAIYQRDMEVRSMTNFTSLKTGPQAQYDTHSRADLRSPQQLEREIVRQRGFVGGRRATSHPHLLDEPQNKMEPSTSQPYDRSRRNSHSNLLEVSVDSHRSDERESDDGGFRNRSGPGRSSGEERTRGSVSGSGRRSVESQLENSYRRTPDMNKERRTPEILRERRTPDSIGRIHKDEPSTSGLGDKNDENASQKSADSVYNSSGKTESYTPQPSSSRQTPSRIDDLKGHGKKTTSGSGSDYDKNGGQSSNVDSGRGSVAYSSGRRAEACETSSPQPETVGASQPGTSQGNSQGSEEWSDIVECSLRQILEPKLSALRLHSSESSGSVTPPLPPISPTGHKRSSLPARSSDYQEHRGRRESPRWHRDSKVSAKRDTHFKRHVFGLDTTCTEASSTARSEGLWSRSDSATSVAEGDARAIRRQLRGLENMYAEVLQLLGLRKPIQPRLPSKRRYGSTSSLPSSSVSSRPTREQRRSEHRKKNDLKGINKRFQRLESHVVTLARSVAHLSSEMRTQHLLAQEVDSIRAELSALRHMYRSQQHIRSGRYQAEPNSFSNPERVKRLTKFFGDEPPLMRMFLKKLGYEKYAAILEKERVGAAELPYVGEDKLRSLGVPLGPRMRILKEAGLNQEMHRDDPHTTTTTLAIV